MVADVKGLDKGYRCKNEWFDKEPSEPNATEILFFAILLVAAPENHAILADWPALVCNEAATALEQQSRWKPNESWGMLPCKISKLFEPLKVAYERSWQDAELDCIGAALQAVNLPGSMDNLRMTQLRNHLSHGPGKGSDLKGTKHDPKQSVRDAPPRWRTYSIVRVAALLKQHCAAIKRALKSPEVIEVWKLARDELLRYASARIFAASAAPLFASHPRSLACSAARAVRRMRRTSSQPRRRSSTSRSRPPPASRSCATRSWRSPTS